MSNPAATARFRVQHGEIEMLLQAVERQLRVPGWATAPQALRESFTQLSAKLRIHLALEDDALYPRLATHADGNLRALAQQYQQEMSGIRQTYEAFLAEWLHSNRFSQEASAFTAAATDLFKTLRARFHREDTRLYPMADAAA
ncbi:hypothetical protein VZ95_09460 [Elstera litoralis]|uniref:Hemerythrin-like domain-containing protein n=1 Tax=Elstera litoralis TaxID=552518 RepID=A0A0F3IVY0_9PROT|nr:hemerythrin domain-containing protein [Elstera litoralis]KJV09754.1 hypothetical protein VZ95_09460 [Elstera litoralis]